MNRTIMIHTTSGPIFCIGEELLKEILSFVHTTPRSGLAKEMATKLKTHLDEDKS